MITVLEAGRLCSVQDQGRTGLRHLGIGGSGSMDALALAVANLLVGNEPGAAGIELTLGPVRLRFETAVRFSLTGADWAATLDDEPVHAWWRYAARAGQCLVLRRPRAGMRGYLAVEGGIDVPMELGSRSVDFAGGFGGGFGRALENGDRLPTLKGQGKSGHGEATRDIGCARLGVKAPSLCRRLQPRATLTTAVPTTTVTTATTKTSGAVASAVDATRQTPSWPGTTPAAAHARDADTLVVRVLPGAEYEQFTLRARETFWSQRWTVTANSDRMGYRMRGMALERKSEGDLLSHAVLPGTIQVPPDGQPIVLMRDAQTTGGYPRVGTVIEADLWRLAQVRLNAAVLFVAVDLNEARRALREVNRYLLRLGSALRHASTAQACADAASLTTRTQTTAQVQTQ